MMAQQTTITKAMVFAAGMGQRMRPLTDNCPKPLISVAGRTMLDRTLDALVDYGIQKTVVNGHYKAEMVEKLLQKRADIHTVFSHEETLLETGGGVKKVLAALGDEPFFVINGDIVWIDGATSALQRLAEFWHSDAMDILLLLQDKKKAIGYEGPGDFDMVDDGQLFRHEPPRPFVFTGVQILHPRLFRNAPDGPFSLSTFYLGGKLENGLLPRVFGLEHEGDWLHIGTPEGLKEAEDFLKEKAFA